MARGRKEETVGKTGDVVVIEASPECGAGGMLRPTQERQS
jgi:hypothetical protein